MKLFLIVLAVLGGILLLLGLLVFFGRAKVRIRFRKELRVTLYVCGVPIPIGKEKKEKPKKKNLSRCRNPEQVLRRELKRQKKAAKKAEKREQQKKNRKLKKAERKRQHEKSTSSLRLMENLELILQILKTLRKETKGRIGLRIRAMQIRIGTEDAAKTAILYGTVLQSASFLLGWIDTHFKRVPNRDGELEVVPDYLSGTTSANIDLECSMYLSQILMLAVKLLSTHQSTKKRLLKRARTRHTPSKKF